MDERDQNGVASQEAEEERARARRRLRADQDAEYQAALLQDQVFTSGVVKELGWIVKYISMNVVL